MSQSFSFIKLFVADHRKMSDFYCKVLGMQVQSFVVDGEGEDEHEESILGFGDDVGSEMGADMIIVQEYHRPAPAPGEVTTVFWVDDANAVAKAAVENGGSIAIPISDDHRFDTRTGYIKDPEGHRFQIMQRL